MLCAAMRVCAAMQCAMQCAMRCIHCHSNTTHSRCWMRKWCAAQWRGAEVSACGSARRSRHDARGVTARSSVSAARARSPMPSRCTRDLDAEPMHSRPGHANARRSRARYRLWESVARCDGGAWCTARRTSGSAFTSVSAARAHSPMPSRCTRDLDVPRRDHCVCARRVVQNQASAPI